jgi:ribosomal protein S12 methylthiotransferase accessory factor
MGAIDFKLTGWRMRKNAGSPLVDEAVASKTFRKGTHRTIAPAETVARMRPLLPAFGVTRIANLTGLDRIGVPVVMVCRPNARSSAVFHGKGLDVAAAKASGIMEAVETWHAEHIRLPLRLHSVAELRRSESVADVRRLPLTIGSRFDDDLPILWVEGDDLVGGGRMWVPFETVHMDATLREASGAGCFAASTNGLASGNHLLEATSHALCEVIERDATTLWRRRRQARRDGMRLDLATVGDDSCRAILQRLYDTELDVAVWDVTSDIGVPAFQCVVLDRTGEISHLGQGSGCHPSAEIALMRALTEAVQVRTTYIVGSREDIRHDDYFRETLDARTKSARFMMRPVATMRDFRKVPSSDFEDLRAEVDWIVDSLKSAGIRQVVAVDLTRPEFGVPVVRVVIPGLEGSDHLPDYTPGERARAAGYDLL